MQQEIAGKIPAALAKRAVLLYTYQKMIVRSETMDLKVLAVGDVVGKPGLDRVSRSLR